MVRTTFPSSLSYPGERCPFELLVDIFTVSSFISQLHSCILHYKRIQDLFCILIFNNVVNTHEGMVGREYWKITSMPSQSYTITPAPPSYVAFFWRVDRDSRTGFGSSKQKISFGWGQKIGTEAIFGAAFAFYSLILCPDAGTEWKSRRV